MHLNNVYGGVNRCLSCTLPIARYFVKLRGPAVYNIGRGSVPSPRHAGEMHVK